MTGSFGVFLSLMGCPSPPEPAAPSAGEGQRSAPLSTSVEAEKVEPAPSAASAPHFVDVSEASGVAFRQISGRSGRRYYLEPHGGGCAVMDANADGRPDLYAVDGGRLPGYQGVRQPANRLYLNQGDGRFEEVSEAAGVQGKGYGFGAFPADYDGDGDEDLFVTNFGPDALYRNLGDGRFEEVAGQANLADAGWSTGAVWLDGDADGDLDLFVSHYVSYSLAKNRRCWRGGQPYHCSPYDYPAEADHYYRNRGDGSFEDVSAEVGLSAEAGKALGALAYDVDLDGRVDIYVANDETPNQLYRNLGDGRFADVALEWGLAVNASGAVQAGMGVDGGDLDGDGDPDLVVANFQGEWNNDFRQLGPGFFRDRGAVSGFGPPSLRRLGFSVLLFDANLDGALDAFVGNGHVWDNVAQMEPTVSYGQKNQLLVGGEGRFRDLSASAGEAFSRREVTRGACLFDLEGDGDLDIFYVNLDAPATLLRNDTERDGKHWLSVSLRGRGGNRAALGARVTVELDGQVLRRQLWGARGYLSSSTREVHFGLGKATRVERLRVRWPDGSETEKTKLGVDQRLRLEQPPASTSPTSP